MELSVNIRNLFRRYDFETRARLYSEAGFRCVDYSLEEMVADDNVLNTDSYRERAEYIRRTCEGLGMRINQTHAPFTFKMWADDEGYNGIILPRLHRAMEISAIFGAEVCVMHPLHHFVYHGHEEEIFERNMDFYRGLIPYCREYGVQLGVENMWQIDPLRKNCTYDTCGQKEEFVRYIDTLDSEYIVACLDVGHVGLPCGSDDRAEDFVRALGHDRLKALHIHDNDFRGDQHLLPYLGRLNWDAITRALGEIDYTGVFTYEVGAGIVTSADDEFVPVALNYMYRLGRHLADKVDAARV